MLNGTLSLHGINNVEAFVLAIVQRSRLELSHHDREDLIAYLITETWRLSTTYQKHHIYSFSTYAGTTLRKRAIDWQRQRFGRTRWVSHDRVIERELPQFVSLDDDDSGRDRLDTALGTGTGDPAADSDPDLERLDGARDRERVRDYEILGVEPPRRAPC